MSSTVFYNKLDVPRASRESPDRPIELEEESEILKALLDIMYPGTHFNAGVGPSFTFYKSLCMAAKKYDIPAALGLVRSLVPAAGRRFPPILVYGLMYELGWEEEMKVASTQTLGYDLLSTDLELQNQLSLCDRRAVTRLMMFHRSRRVQLIEALNFEDLGNSSFWYSVATCGHLPPALSLKGFLFLSKEMDNCPSGDSLRTRPFFFESKLLEELWTQKCSRINIYCSSNSAIINKEKLISRIVEELDKPPKTI
ncbi:hypothetical protein EW145_g2625 [Phellinidium pouzarii]|uniref:BTB domain-containing protein n=1 Tax=Phellinidium pouzarii TaxID=167371 RepID=A0A4V3XD65_9AGAM|nr:hypothetical protein EW145_g2625 [Phellinidium pouzarii]